MWLRMIACDFFKKQRCVFFLKSNHSKDFSWCRMIFQFYFLWVQLICLWFHMISYNVLWFQQISKFSMVVITFHMFSYNINLKSYNSILCRMNLDEFLYVLLIVLWFMIFHNVIWLPMLSYAFLWFHKSSYEFNMNSMIPKFHKFYNHSYDCIINSYDFAKILLISKDSYEFTWFHKISNDLHMSSYESYNVCGFPMMS